MTKMTNREIDERIAIHLFSWEWMSWHGIPIRGTPGYPVKCRVRGFLNPETIAGEAWQTCFAKNSGRHASGKEPLCYSYCSSQGGCHVPEFHGADDIRVLERVRELWPRESEEWRQFEAALPAITDYQQGAFSRAALLVLRRQGQW